MHNVQSQTAKWESKYTTARKACEAQEDVVSRYETGHATQQEVNDARERASQAWKDQKTAKTELMESLESLGLSHEFPGLVSLQMPVPDLQANPPTWLGEEALQLFKGDTEAGASSAGTIQPAQ